LANKTVTTVKKKKLKAAGGGGEKLFKKKRKSWVNPAIGKVRKKNRFSEKQREKNELMFAPERKKAVCQQERGRGARVTA